MRSVAAVRRYRGEMFSSEVPVANRIFCRRHAGTKLLDQLWSRRCARYVGDAVSVPIVVLAQFGPATHVSVTTGVITPI